MYSLYLYLASLTVTLHVSVLVPSPMHPDQTGIITCSGVFVSPDEILTNYHCIEESRGFQWVRTYEQKSFSVVVEKKDKDKDLALLKILKPIKHKYVSFGDPVLKTETVYTVNSGGDTANTFNTGIINNIVIDPETKVLSVLHSATYMHGASGSGLFNTKKQLIGLNVAKIDDLMEAIDITEIVTFLRCGK